MTCCSKKKVMVLATGGTIAMKMDEKIGALVPACTGEDLVAAVPGLDKVAHVEVEQICNVASPNMLPVLSSRTEQTHLKKRPISLTLPTNRISRLC